MKKAKALPLLAATTLLAAQLGCANAANPAQPAPAAQQSPVKDPVKDMTIDKLVELRQAGSAVVLDANTAEFRRDNGIIPGAVLLTSYSKYDLAQLPADKSSKLVFYCTSRL